eukprot:1920075-Rhodomonas_salina.3
MDEGSRTSARLVVLVFELLVVGYAGLVNGFEERRAKGTSEGWVLPPTPSPHPGDIRHASSSVSVWDGDDEDMAPIWCALV